MNTYKSSQSLRLEFERLSSFYASLAKEQMKIELQCKNIEQSDADDANKIKLLSEKEKEVFDLISQGLKPKEISIKLARSQKTVETQRHTIIARLGLKNVAELNGYAERNKT